MSRNEVIQVSFTPVEAERIRENAEMLGLSQSAYVRRLVVNTLGTYAWWVRPMDPPMTVMAMRSMGGSAMRNEQPDFYIERIGEAGSEYLVFNHEHEPMTFKMLLAECGDMYREIHDGRLVIYGDWNDLRIIEESIGDANRNGQLRWRLGFDRRDGKEIFRPFTPPIAATSP